MKQEKISNLLKDILTVDNTTLDNIDMSFIRKYEMYHEIDYFFGQSNREHYRLLSYISTKLNEEKIFDIGTNKCMSAIALSKNHTNKVCSYDISRILPKNPDIQNIEFIIGDSTEDKSIQDSFVIFLDVDHDGLYEDKFYNHLKEIKWDGLLILDDIHLNKEMIEFWTKITEKKYDITTKGHWSGTGIVVFSFEKN